MAVAVNKGMENAVLCTDEMKMNLSQPDGMSKTRRKIGSAHDPTLTIPSVKRIIYGECMELAHLSLIMV